MFAPSQELIGLLRLLLFIGLIGLFVMIESRAGQGLDAQLLSGLGRERPKFTTGLMAIALLLVVYPLAYFPGSTVEVKVLLGILTTIGLVWVFIRWF